MPRTLELLEEKSKALEKLGRLQTFMNNKEGAALAHISRGDDAKAIKSLREALERYEQDITAVSAPYKTLEGAVLGVPSDVDALLVAAFELKKKIEKKLLEAEARIAARQRDEEARLAGSTDISPSLSTNGSQTNQGETMSTPYETAMLKLETIYHATQNEHVKTNVNALVKYIQMLHRRNHSPKELTAVIDSTAQILAAYNASNPTQMTTALDNFETLAKRVEGHPSTALKVLGGFMLALAVTIAIVGVLAAPTISILLAFTVASSLAAAETMAIAGITTAATLPVLAGAGFFALGCSSGLSNAMYNVEETMSEQGYPSAPVAAA